MREALRMGKTQSRITFEEVNSKPNAIAVGVLTTGHIDSVNLGKNSIILLPAA